MKASKPPREIAQRLLISNVPLSSDHYEQIKAETEIEREWYKEVTPFASYEHINAAVIAGKLTKVEPARDYLPILRFRNPDLHETYPPFLKLKTKRLLDEVTSRWRTLALKKGINERIRLAISALVMSESYRNKLLQSDKLAIDKGPHVLGEAFDIDGCGYYLGDIPINPRPKTQGEWDAAFAHMGVSIPRPDFDSYSKYDPKVHETLKRILDIMMTEGKLHYVLEFPETTNASFHICRHPDYR